MKTALVIRHVAFEDLGLFERSIEAAGYQIRYLEAGMDELAWIEPLDPDLFIVLGGPIGANDEQDYPFIHDELNILETRLNCDAPTLGICLGAQLMARALGARVYPGLQKEVGWKPLMLTDVGKDSPLKHLSPEHTPVLHWHGDTFDLPEGATLLASTDVVRHQAFRWKKRGLALQFHPEVTVHGMERWYIGHSCEIQHSDIISIHQLREDTQKYGYAMEMYGNAFMDAWLESIKK
ncbi:MAG: glutamine amidotransferase [Gammaproteobacteria bacterium]|nr:MAG: glutamine amidotransferase [Gammaproteobacteria bacterium]